MNKKIFTLALSTTLLSANAFSQTLEGTSPIKKMEIAQPENSPIKYALKEEDSSFSAKGFQLGVGIGVLGGANAQIGYRIPQHEDNFWKNRFGFRLDYNSWKPLDSYIEDYLDDHPIKIDDNEIKAKIKGENFGALIDFYPFGNTWALGNFRISAGYYTGDFSINGELKKTAGEKFSMKSDNNQKLYYEVDATANLKAGLDYDINGPYAGLGFDFGLFWGLKMYLDAGVVFTDKPEITTDISGTGNIKIYSDENYTNLITTAPVDTSNTDIQKLLDDTKTQYEDELNSIRKGYFPIIKLGFLFRF